MTPRIGQAYQRFLKTGRWKKRSQRSFFADLWSADFRLKAVTTLRRCTSGADTAKWAGSSRKIDP
jgi:hypothetical protein